VKAAPIFTIGHSDREQAEFLEALQNCRIGFVVDIRTSPGSMRYPQFNRSVLEANLPTADIKYLYLGDALGARRTEPQVLNLAGQVWYPKVRNLVAFKSAIARIEKGAGEGHRIALMCSEGSPLDCHRLPMIAYQLARNGFEVRHILRDGTVKTHAEIEDQLLERFSGKIPQPGLFQQNIGRAEQLEAAYEQLNAAIGWKPFEIENPDQGNLR
jgi:uncharacterized protein (DUF488 family)